MSETKTVTEYRVVGNRPGRRGDLGFKMEERGEVLCVVYDDGGCHPANACERTLWDALVEKDAQLLALARRCESEAIEAAADQHQAASLAHASHCAGRKNAFNTVERWIGEMIGGKG